MTRHSRRTWTSQEATIPNSSLRANTRAIRSFPHPFTLRYLRLSNADSSVLAPSFQPLSASWVCGNLRRCPLVAAEYLKSLCAPERITLQPILSFALPPGPFFTFTTVHSKRYHGYLDSEA